MTPVMNAPPSATIRKVFLGCCDNASLLHDFSVGFRALGYEVMSFVHAQAPIQGSPVDYSLEQLVPALPAHATVEMRQHHEAARQAALRAVFELAVRECDLFLFVWDSFLPDFTDLLTLKRLGKMIVWWFVGCDSRWKSAYDAEVAGHGLPPLHFGEEVTVRELTERLLRIRMVERCADVVFNTPSQAALLLRPYHDGLQWPLALDRYPEHHGQRDVPVVMHAPSNLRVKCTREITLALETLRFDEGLNFEIRLMPRLPHGAALAAYAECDVFVGQGRSLTLGKQDREVLALNRVLVGGPTPALYPQRWPDDCPNVAFQTGDDLVVALRPLLSDVQRRHALAERGRAWVSRYHDPSRTCARVLAALDGSIPPDFHPTFYRTSFEPEDEGYRSLHDKTLALVREMAWYREVVPQGERAGLHF